VFKNPNKNAHMGRKRKPHMILADPSHALNELRQPMHQKNLLKN
jgi:hypothetical protein